jgi:hypothetical protein
MRVSTAVAMLGAAAVLVGSVGPWVTTPFGSISGVSGKTDGWVTLGCAVADFCLLAARARRPWASVLAFVAFAGALGIAGFDGGRVVEATSTLTVFEVHVAGARWGIFVVGAGAAVACIALATDAIIVRQRDSQGRALAFLDLRAATLGLSVIVGAASAVAGVRVERAKQSTASNARPVVSSANPTSAPSSGQTPATQTGEGVVVETCPSTYGVTGRHPIPAALPSVHATGGLVFFANTALAVLAPEGWRCSGAVGADGFGQLTVTPAAGSEAITAAEGSACVSCNAALACPVIPAAAQALPAGVPFPSHRPAAEEISRISATTAAFEDPPYVHGTGAPLGGPDPANGAVLYSGQPPEGFKETCTLPASQHSLCTAILNDFLSRYPG